MSMLGIELGASRVRVVVQPRRGAPEVHDLPWSPDDPARLVDALAACADDVRGISVAVGLAHLSVQRVTLPPARAADQRRMLRIDLDRWFPLAATEDAAVGVDARSGLAFAMRAEALTAWVDALATLAPVLRVEPAPVTLVRALVAGGLRDGVASIDGTRMRRRRST